jgi:hypothetical protein
MAPLPEDLKRARQLLDEAERAEKPKDRLRGYKSAFALMDKHNEANPGSPHADFISNIRRTYTRALVRELPITADSDFNDWLGHALLLTKLSNELDDLTMSDPELRQQYDDFLMLYAEDFLRAMEIRKRNTAT